MLLCTVRTCHEPLQREERRYVCPRGHSFDVARSGYVNLLQPNERRARAPGDSAEALRARRRNEGVLAGMAGEAKELLLGEGGLRVAQDSHVLDVGCGDGWWLSQMEGRERVGVDISTAAIDFAARRDRRCLWIVANADRFLPFSDGSFDLLLSITARMNSAEFRRVLREGGRLLVAVAGPDDLIELRGQIFGGRRGRVFGEGSRGRVFGEGSFGEGSDLRDREPELEGPEGRRGRVFGEEGPGGPEVRGRIFGEAAEPDRAARAVETFAGHFALVARRRASVRVRLDRQAIRDVMTSSYRAMRTRERALLEGIEACDVTFSRDLLLFAAGSRGTPPGSSA